MELVHHILIYVSSVQLAIRPYCLSRLHPHAYTLKF